MNRPNDKRINLSARFERELETKIKSWEKQGYVVKDRGVWRDSHGVVERQKNWAVMVKLLCQTCGGRNASAKLWKVDVTPTIHRIVCDVCRADFIHNPMVEIKSPGA